MSEIVQLVGTHVEPPGKTPIPEVGTWVCWETASGRQVGQVVPADDLIHDRWGMYQQVIDFPEWLYGVRTPDGKYFVLSDCRTLSEHEVMTLLRDHPSNDEIA